MGTIAQYYPGSIFRRNVFTAGQAANYPVDNYYPPSVDTVQFVDVAGGNYRLSATSPYRSAATDGGAVGADQTAIEGLVPIR